MGAFARGFAEQLGANAVDLASERYERRKHRKSVDSIVAQMTQSNPVPLVQFRQALDYVLTGPLPTTCGFLHQHASGSRERVRSLGLSQMDQFKESWTLITDGVSDVAGLPQALDELDQSEMDELRRETWFLPEITFALGLARLELRVYELAEQMYDTVLQKSDADGHDRENFRATPSFIESAIEDLCAYQSSLPNSLEDFGDLLPSRILAFSTTRWVGPALRRGVPQPPPPTTILGSLPTAPTIPDDRHYSAGLPMTPTPLQQPVQDRAA